MGPKGVKGGVAWELECEFERELEWIFPTRFHLQLVLTCGPRWIQGEAAGVEG